MELKALNSKERKQVLEMLERQFGFKEDMDYEFYLSQKDKLYLISKDISKIKADELRVNSLGLYFGELNEGEIRLSIEGSQIIGKHATKNVVEVDDAYASRWMNGEDIDIKATARGYVLIMNKMDFLGCGRTASEKIMNFVPKERRVKTF